MTDAPPPAPPTSRLRVARAASIVLGLLASVIAALAVWTFSDQRGCSAETPALFTRLYAITSDSMAPAILTGDRVWAERRYYCDHDPRRGDLAVLVLPNEPRTVFVKRIVGLPGDRVQLKLAQLYINGEPVAHDWMESAIHAAESGEAQGQAHFSESFSGGPRYVVEIADQEGPLENTDEINVPDGAYFVLGDNRDKSDDSRAFGPVPRASIVDRPVRVLWGADWDRLGLPIDGRP
jgi:signal peptidase I